MPISNRERIANRENPIGKGGRASERRLADDLRGELMPVSGAMASAKGDVCFRSFLLESKATERRSLSIKLGWLIKITNEALAKGKIPALAFQFITGDGTSERGGEWVAIPRHIFDELTRGDDEA